MVWDFIIVGGLSGSLYGFVNSLPQAVWQVVLLLLL